MWMDGSVVWDAAAFDPCVSISEPDMGIIHISIVSHLLTLRRYQKLGILTQALN